MPDWQMVGGSMGQENNESTETLYPIDAQTFEVSFNARPNGKPAIISHKLRKPTMAELVSREQASAVLLIEGNHKDEQVITDEESANSALWDKIILEVRGYANNQEWKKLEPEEKAAVRASHKSIAIRSLYQGEASIDSDEDAAISLSANQWIVRHTIGAESNENPAHVLRHVLREPTESERSKYKKGATKTSFIRGNKKTTTRIAQDLQSYVDLYNALIQEVQGGSVNGMQWNEFSRNQFLMAMDPVWKKLVIQTLMGSIEAALLD
jgi:hypothetical protein